ncbi:MAG: glycoside hydrolase family 127 protein [Bacteroidales bacterium]|nr:glycoside hydrolase family 127 protein [Bacteroidales bacterium]
MKRISLLLLLAATITSAIAQIENSPTGMGLERVARLFTEVYQSPKAESNDETLWIQIDLGESKKIDAVKLYPRVQVYDVVVSEGFPEMFRIEASDDPEFKTVVQIADKSRGFPDPYDKVCTFEAEKVNGILKKRYVRITAIKLRQQHLAFTKIDVLSDGKNIAEGCNVSESKSGDLGKNIVTRAARPNGEGVVTNNPHNVIPEKQWKPVVYKAQAPPAGSVALIDGVFKTTLDNNVDYLMSTFTVDELTRSFRARAGKEVEPFNEALSRQWMYNLPGSEAGRFLMGAGNTLKWQENAALRTRMNKIIDVIDDCKEADGYIMAYKEEDIFTAENGAYVRSWVTHGLLDAGYGGNDKAFGLVRGYYDWFDNCPYLPELLRRSGQGPQGIIPITRTYFSPVGKSQDIYTVQQYFQENYFMDGLANREKSIIWSYPYDRPHNYLLTAIEPYFDLYRATGDEKYFEAVKGGWDLYKENWLHVGGSIAICEGTELYPPKSYFLTRHTGELCGSVFWIKLNQRFHLLNPEEEKYVNEIEKCIYNVGIANQKGVNGIRYFNRLVGQKDQVHGPYVQKMNSCCEGQGTRLYGSLPEFIYSLSEDGVYINLFAASNLSHTTQSGELQLIMETDFPYDNKVSITLISQKSLKTNIRVRVPSWAAKRMIVRVNGKKAASGEPGTYVTLPGTWNAGDNISFELPMEFKATVYKGLEKGYNDGSHYIVEYGPLLMAAVNQKNPQGKVELYFPESKLERSFSPIQEKPLFFSIKGNDDVVFRPYFELQDELFTCYPAFTYK